VLFVNNLSDENKHLDKYVKCQSAFGDKYINLPTPARP